MIQGLQETHMSSMRPFFFLFSFFLSIGLMFVTVFSRVLREDSDELPWKKSGPLVFYLPYALVSWVGDGHRSARPWWTQNGWKPQATPLCTSPSKSSQSSACQLFTAFRSPNLSPFMCFELLYLVLCFVSILLWGFRDAVVSLSFKK